MSVNRNLIGVKGDECDCGRRKSIRHCPGCGSPRIYARMNRAHKMLSGEMKFVEVEFRCQSCGHLFIEEEREFCDAPPVGVKLAAQRVKAVHEAKQTGEFMNPQDQKLAVALGELLPKQEEKTPLEKWHAFRRLETQLTNVYIDEKVALARQSKQPKESLREFVDRHLAEMHVERVEEPPREASKSEKEEQSHAS